MEFAKTELHIEDGSLRQRVVKGTKIVKDDEIGRAGDDIRLGYMIHDGGPFLRAFAPAAKFPEGETYDEIRDIPATQDNLDLLNATIAGLMRGHLLAIAYVKPPAPAPVSAPQGQDLFVEMLSR